MQCYTEFLPPTAVTHSIALPFLTRNANNLIVAKTSLLQVFEVRQLQSRASSSDDEPTQRSKLVLVGEYPLAGTVTSLSAVKTLNTRTGGDAVLISFKDAKLSLIEWDPENYRTSTISIHFYEGENIISQPFGPSLSETESILTVDPSSRCAALKFGARNLAIIPFRQQGDDLGEGLDEDTEMTSPALKRTTSGLNGDASDEAAQTPYKSSFVLPLTALDPVLTHTVHLSFLHGYREPTFGILFSSMEPSYALAEERQNCLNYTVFTLDLEQRASTNLMSVPKLPTDLWKVISLPLPVGGALLVGTNELIHVDQNGKTNAVAVNEFAPMESDFNMVYQSDLNMKLEDCEIEVLDANTGELLILLNDGSAAILSFKLFGRSVGGLAVSKLSSENGGNVVKGLSSAVTSMSGNNLFVGSDTGDSVLLSWTRGASTGRKRSHAQMEEEVVENDSDDGDDMDDDDLYAPSKETTKRTASSSNQDLVATASSYRLEVDDILTSVGPINSVCFGRSSHVGKDKLEMYAGVGRGNASQLIVANKEITPHSGRATKFESAKSGWAVKTGKSATENMLFVYDGENTKPYDIAGFDSQAKEGSLEANGYKDAIVNEFEQEGETLSVSTLANGTRIVQCRRTEIRTYDNKLGLSQIIPMMDEETDAELQIVTTSFCDPYLLVLRDDSSVQILNVDRSGDVEPLGSEGVITEHKWLNGCLYSGSITNDQACVFLLNEQGGLHVLSLPDLKACYVAPNLPFLPPVLSSTATQRRVGARETLTEILVTNLGTEGTEQPYMLVRTSLDELAIYEPFYYNASTESPASDFSNLRFRKVPNNSVPKYDESLAGAEDARPAPLRSIKIGNYHTAYVPGLSPSFVIKEATSLPHVMGIQATNVQAITPLSRPTGNADCAVIDSEGILQEFYLPPQASYGTGWSVRPLPLGPGKQEVRQVAFHEDREVYVVATCTNVDFYFAEEDGRHTEQDDITLRPQVPQYTLHLVSAKTQEVIGTVEMPYLETITELKVMPLEISEHTHEQKSMVVVSSTALRGEAMPAKGALTVFDIIDAVPDPERPETAVKLKILSREEGRGAMTTIAPFPGGLIGTAQGQKIYVRGLKEDGSCLPVAFFDAQCYSNTMKSLGSSGMWLCGDAWKGLWFGGFTEEPYRLTMLGKSDTHMEVVTAEFLPFDGQLFLLVVDADMDLHVLQYDPENPKSVSGTRLIPRGTFHLGHFPTSMTLLPSTLAPFTEQALSNEDEMDEGEDQAATPPAALFHVFTTSQTGSVGLITPVDEDTYRRLSALQTHLTSILEHAAGLNPRAFRAAESESSGVRGGVVDGSLVQRISELGASKRAEVLGRVGADAWVMRSDLEIIGGGGLGYL